MKYRDCIFDLYGTLVDIRTDETLPGLWEDLAAWYRGYGADYAPGELRDAYLRTVRQMEGGASPLRNDAHEAHPEIRLELAFQELFRAKGVDAGLDLAVCAGGQFRKGSLDYIRLYDGAAELLKALRANGQGVWLLSNAQRIFTAHELQTLGIGTLFDGVYLSSDYGCKKPDRRFFEALLEERGIARPGAVMICNDGVCDIQGARAVGLSTLYIRSNLSPEEPLPEADHVLPEMDLRLVRTILTS